MVVKGILIWVVKNICIVFSCMCFLIIKNKLNFRNENLRKFLSICGDVIKNLFVLF